MFGNDRTQLRQVFLDAWRKRLTGETLEPLEQLIAGIVAEHPEYHNLLADPERALTQEFLPEAGQSNPFLHMAMHISLQEQVGTDRPNGITGLYQRLSQRLGDTHAAEHQLMECLAQMLWQAQTAQSQPDERAYLECVRRLVS